MTWAEIMSISQKLTRTCHRRRLREDNKLSVASAARTSQIHFDNDINMKQHLGKLINLIPETIHLLLHELEASSVAWCLMHNFWFDAFAAARFHCINEEFLSVRTLK